MGTKHQLYGRYPLSFVPPKKRVKVRGEKKNLHVVRIFEIRFGLETLCVFRTEVPELKVGGRT